MLIPFKTYSQEEFYDLFSSCPICNKLCMGQFGEASDFYRECSKCDIDFIFEKEYIEILIGTSAFVNGNSEFEFILFITEHPQQLDFQIAFNDVDTYADINFDFSQPLNINDIYKKYQKYKILQ